MEAGKMLSPELERLSAAELSQIVEHRTEALARREAELPGLLSAVRAANLALEVQRGLGDAKKREAAEREAAKARGAAQEAEAAIAAISGAIADLREVLRGKEAQDDTGRRLALVAEAEQTNTERLRMAEYMLDEAVGFSNAVAEYVKCCDKQTALLSRAGVVFPSAGKEKIRPNYLGLALENAARCCASS